ncbi:hypothetical protein [Thermoproteus uzoniensis]|uniref:hypothetical protein n=1 Tax=Thermoproteus uzoniensis TaxID=184117 RepID=UPI0011E4ED47|nr:hypothetical protein [Thermoproteus uzoniensis]
MFVSIQRVLDKLQALVGSRGYVCSPNSLDLELSSGLFLSGSVAVLGLEGGYRCLDIGGLADALRTFAHPQTIQQSVFKTLKPPYVELYEDERKYVVMGIYDERVYMAEWSGIRLCCSWIVDIDVDRYRRSYEALADFLSREA